MRRRGVVIAVVVASYLQTPATVGRQLRDLPSYSSRSPRSGRSAGAARRRRSLSARLPCLRARLNDGRDACRIRPNGGACARGSGRGGAPAGCRARAASCDQPVHGRRHAAGHRRRALRPPPGRVPLLFVLTTPSPSRRDASPMTTAVAGRCSTAPDALPSAPRRVARRRSGPRRGCKRRAAASGAHVGSRAIPKAPAASTRTAGRPRTSAARMRPSRASAPRAESGRSRPLLSARRARLAARRKRSASLMSQTPMPPKSKQSAPLCCRNAEQVTGRRLGDHVRLPASRHSRLPQPLRSLVRWKHVSRQIAALKELPRIASASSAQALRHGHRHERGDQDCEHQRERPCSARPCVPGPAPPALRRPSTPRYGGRQMHSLCS